MKWIWWMGLVIVGSLLVGCAGEADSLKLDADSNAGKAVLAQTGILAVTLVSNPSTGYTWSVVSVDNSILVQQGDPVFAQTNQNNVVGSWGTETFRFKGMALGKTQLVLGYRRAWQKDEVPIRTFQVEIEVVPAAK